MAGMSEAGLLVQQLLSLWQQGMGDSTRILGDLLLSGLSLKDHPELQLHALLTYSDSLSEDQQYRRALLFLIAWSKVAFQLGGKYGFEHYYKEALKVLSQIPHIENKPSEKPLPTGGEIKWRMYKCHMTLKESQEALDILSSIPLKQRDAKIAVALGKLYHHFKNDSKCAVICYKQAVSMCPLALDAAVGLLSLGMTLPEVISLAASKVSFNPLASIGWISQWLEVQACIIQHDHHGALGRFDRLAKTGFNLSVESNCQLAWCMVKLGRKTAAEELFSTAQIQDPYVLKHMDTYARILSTSTKKLERLSSELLYVSTLHPEPWVAKAWYQTRNKEYPPTERAKACNFIQKACLICPNNAEAVFFQASLCFAKQELHSAIQKYSEAVRLDPTFFDAYEALIRCYLVVRSDKEAINLAQMAGKHFKQRAQQYYLEGVALSQKPSTSVKAKIALEKAIKADKTFEKAPLTLCNIFIHEGNIEIAAQLLTKHLESYSSPPLHTELGNCLVRLKRYQEAMDQYGLALCLDPKFEKALQGIAQLQKLNSSDLDDTGSVGAGSELEDEGEDILVARGLEDALEMDSDDSIPVMDLANQDYQW